MNTTYEGFERYLDPYLTTSRLYLRPYTAEQLKKISNSKDVVTYYILADVPWVWSRKPKHDEWTLRQRRPQSTFDREKFKGDFREIRTHNKLQWVPGSFRTEVKDNYALFVPKINDQLDTYEDDVITGYLRAVAKLKTNTQFEYSSINRNYSSENSQIGSTKPICSVFEQCANKSKRLERKIANIK
ncbi:unnamed protein product [Parnassius apollo]|uniref:(apollo) hypothetical protein n=1 Tax=Parnassius apollo TaxID=110799 RepID=A0A8S3X723_PARAO|nr:unnamed protein product [Parnassius apollo]